MRVGIYFTPPADHPLVRVAADWLGRDAFSGRVEERGAVDGLTPGDVDELTASPRRYGFHATLKPPFRLAEGRTRDEVGVALAAFVGSHAPTTIPSLALSRIGAFFALTSDDELGEINDLAADAVRAFEPFRAPLNADEFARRRPERLTTAQRENLEHWGYPYLFDEFRFHMTLTGPVPEARRDAVEAVLRRRFADFIGQPLPVDGVALFCEPAPPGDFVVASYAEFPPVASAAGG